jgi:hypothetical protein
MTDKTISIAIIETKNLEGAVRAVFSTLAVTPATAVYWISDNPCPVDFAVPTQWVRIRSCQQPRDQFNLWYSNITLRLLPAVVSTDFNIVVQCDGFAVNARAWTDEFLQYDYIGAPWLWWGPPEEQVGNGGFSLRSRRLYDALIDWRPSYHAQDWPNLDAKYYSPNSRDGLNEDNLLAGPYRQYLEQHYQLKWAPTDLAHRWSIECSESYSNPWFKQSLGFHGRETAQHYGIKL